MCVLQEEEITTTTFSQPVSPAPSHSPRRRLLLSGTRRHVLQIQSFSVAKTGAIQIDLGGYELLGE